MINDPEYSHVAADLRTRLERWMEETSEPLDGPVPAPPGAQINAQDQLSAAEPTFPADGAMVGVATDAPA